MRSSARRLRSPWTRSMTWVRLPARGDVRRGSARRFTALVVFGSLPSDSRTQHPRQIGHDDGSFPSPDGQRPGFSPM